MDTSNMLINPDKKGYVWNNHPELKMRKDLCTIPEKDFELLEEKYVPTLEELNKLVIFVAYFCDPGSPHYKQISLDIRISECKKSANIDDNEWLAEVIHGRHWWFCKILSSYIKIFGEHDMQTWIALVLDAAEKKEFLAMPVNYLADDVEKRFAAKAMIQKSLPALDGSLKELEKKLFPNSFIKEAVTSAVTSDGIGSWAEIFAHDYSP